MKEITPREKSIREMLLDLDAGHELEVEAYYEYAGARTRSTATLWEGGSAKGDYIYWNFFGQSASRRSVRNLKWIIREMLEHRRGPVAYTVKY